MIKKKMHKLKDTLPRKRSEKQEVPERITNETVAQHREKILAGGRKFKYPVQYARHRLVINAILITLFAVLVFIGIVWWQLYQTQSTSAFFYRITQLVPLPVAQVDGQDAPYSNYLMEYRSSIHWLQTKSRDFNFNSSDGQRQSEHIKRLALDSAIEIAYAQKLAKQYGITVSDKEVDEFIKSTLEAGDRKLSHESYEAVLGDSFAASEAEYRSSIKNALLKQKVAFKVDYAAKKKVIAVQQELTKGKSFDAVALKYSDDEAVKANKGDVGFVPKDNRDNGLAKQALTLQKNQVSKPIEGRDGYYFVKLIDTNDTQVRYAVIKINLETFDKQLAQLKKQGKVIEHISVEEVKNN